jgi:lysophospholipase L1-like esterase
VWKLLSLVKWGWLLAGLILLLAVLLELAAALSLRLFARGSPELPPGAPPTYELHGPTSAEWRPYIYWRTRARSGPHLNMDADGLRRTWNADPGDADPMRVFMFGASTLLGYKVRDDYTTPSFVAKVLARECEVPVVVTNFGQMGYVSTQDLIALLLELQRGNVPDVAVFYNGTVDIESSYDAQVAGFPRWEHLRRDAFQDFRRAVLVRLARRSSLVELGLLYVDGWNWAIPGVWKPPQSDQAFQRLAEETLRVYASNVKLADGLGKGLGFDVMHFWQPVIWSQRSLSPYERSVVAAAERKNPLRGALFQEVYAQAAQRADLQANEHFHDIRDALDDAQEPPLWDATHTTEAGNERIAERIAAPLCAVLERRSTRSRSALGKSRS